MLDKTDRQAYAAINQSLDGALHNIIPVELTRISSHTSPSSLTHSWAKSLYDYLTATYSAARGTRKAELFRVIRCADIHEGANPVEAIVNMRRAFNDLIASNATMDDSQLAFTILIALFPTPTPHSRGLFI